MVELSTLAELAATEHGLCVVTSLRADGTIAASVVNAGVLDHPLSGDRVVGFVARGLRKLEHLRADPRATVVARSGWRWAAAEGAVEIFGPDDPHQQVGAEARRLLLRQVFTSAGGTHEDWDEYDRVMAAERRAVVLIAPTRVYSNG